MSARAGSLRDSEPYSGAAQSAAGAQSPGKSPSKPDSSNGKLKARAPSGLMETS